MEAIREAIYTVLADDHPMSVRQMFYRLTTDGVVGKTEAEYKGTVCRLLAAMRRSGDLPYEWLADSTRWMRKPETHSSVEEALRNTANTYRRALWESQDAYVEIWLEKEALAGVLIDATYPWDVPLMVTRGYSSMSFLHAAAEAINTRDKVTHIYYFGDRDPSGVDIDRAIVQGISESLSVVGGETFADWATFTRVAVTEEQIIDLELPTRPTKKSDSRHKGFAGESVELDAVPAWTLREMAERCIRAHVDQHQLGVLRKAETEERRVLEQIAGSLNGNGEAG